MSLGEGAILSLHKKQKSFYTNCEAEGGSFVAADFFNESVITSTATDSTLCPDFI